MKKIILIASICFIYSVSNAQTIVGSWVGKIDIGPRKILFVMHVHALVFVNYDDTQFSNILCHVV